MTKTGRNTIIACIILLAVLAIARSLAFTTASVDTESIVTFGNLALEINETMLGEDGKEIPYTPDNDVPLARQSKVSRIVRVENTGRQPMFVRVALDMQVTDKDSGETADANALAEYALNEEDWTYDDGWYYYDAILEPGSETKELMTEVMFYINEIATDYPGGSLDLDIQAQGVQSKNNGEKALTAQGWPQ